VKNPDVVGGESSWLTLIHLVNLPKNSVCGTDCSVLLIACNRFIPNRSTTDIEVGHFRLVSASEPDDVFEAAETDYQKHASAALGADRDDKILCFSEKPPKAKEGRPSIPQYIIFCRVYRLISWQLFIAYIRAIDCWQSHCTSLVQIVIYVSEKSE